MKPKCFCGRDAIVKVQFLARKESRVNEKGEEIEKPFYRKLCGIHFSVFREANCDLKIIEEYN